MKDIHQHPFWLSMKEPINTDEMAKRDHEKAMQKTIADVKNRIDNLRDLVSLCADALLECDDSSSERVSETLNNYVLKELDKSYCELNYL